MNIFADDLIQTVDLCSPTEPQTLAFYSQPLTIHFHLNWEHSKNNLQLYDRKLQIKM